MKKFVTGMLAGAALFVAGAMPAWAASYPVYVDGNEIGQAQVVNGQTFLPVRAVFEACGARVHWDDGYIIARDNDYRSVSLRVGSKSIGLFHHGLGYRDEELQAAPYLQNGKTYVPVRAVSEALGCEVQWLAKEKCVSVKSKVTRGIGCCELDIKPETGEILLLDKVLAQVPLMVWADTMSTEGSKTDGGNYVLILSDWESGAITVSNYQYVWLNPKTGEFATTLEEPWLARRVGVLWNDDKTKLCLPGDDVAYLIDDAERCVLGEYDLRALAGDSITDENFTLCAVWFDDDYMLVSDYDRTYWGLLDLASGKMSDITAEILTDEVKSAVNAKLWPLAKDLPVREDYADDEEYLAESFWSTLRYRDGALDPHLELHFVGADDGVLKLEMIILGDNYAQEGTVEISYKLK